MTPPPLRTDDPVKVAVIGSSANALGLAVALHRDGHRVALHPGRSRDPLPDPQVGVDVCPPGSAVPLPCAAVILADPDEPHHRMASDLVGRTRWLVSVSEHPGVVKALTAKAPEAARRGTIVVPQATFEGVLAALLVGGMRALVHHLDEVHVVRTARSGGLSLAGRLRRARSRAVEYRDGSYERVRPGAGRSLVWFPEPVGALDCVMDALAEPYSLRLTAPEADRISARVPASTVRYLLRRSRHGDGLRVVRVEVRGRTGGRFRTEVAAAVDRSGLGSVGVVTALVPLLLAHTGSVQPSHRSIVGRSVGWVDVVGPVRALERLAGAGVALARFEPTGDADPTPVDG